MADAHHANDEMASNLVAASITAAIGGSLPTLCRLAGTASSSPSANFSDLFPPGHLAAILMYAVIGFSVCFCFRERRFRQAFILGIAGPGLITNILAGTAVNVERVNNGISGWMIPSFSLVPSAHAASSEERSESKFWTDFKRGLGFSIPLEVSERSSLDDMGRDRVVMQEPPVDRPPVGSTNGDGFTDDLGSLPPFPDDGGKVADRPLANSDDRGSGADFVQFYRIPLLARDSAALRLQLYEAEKAVLQGSPPLTGFENGHHDRRMSVFGASLSLEYICGESLVPFQYLTESVVPGIRFKTTFQIASLALAVELQKEASMRGRIAAGYYEASHRDDCLVAHEQYAILADMIEFQLIGNL